MHPLFILVLLVRRGSIPRRGSLVLVSSFVFAFCYNFDDRPIPTVMRYV
jgi:hypothetical protein